MNIAPASLAKQINSAVAHLAQAEHLIDYRTARVLTAGKGRTLIGWEDSTGIKRPRTNYFSVAEYIREVEARQYTALFANGAFVQVAYSLKKDEVVGHRLVYVPSPIGFSTDDVDREGICELCRTADPTTIRCCGPWRFDFDPDNAGPKHPASHLTTNHSQCRIPVAYPIGVAPFLDLVLRHLHDDRCVDVPPVSSTKANRCLAVAAPDTWYFEHAGHEHRAHSR